MATYGSTVSPRNNRLWLAVALFVAAAFVFGLGLGSVLGAEQSDSKASGAASSKDTTGATGPANSKEGAVEFATGFLVDFPTMVKSSDQKAFESRITRTNYPFSESSFIDDVKASAASTRSTLTSLGTFRVVPTGYSVSADPKGTKVSVQSIGLVIDPGNGKAMSVWTTSDFVLHWFSDEWKIASWKIQQSSSLSPAGSAPNDSVTATKAYFDGFNRYETKP